MSNKVSFEKLVAISLSKGSPEENEDKFHLRPDEGFISLSDGAGGYGLFADDWATQLTQNITPLHITTKNDFQNNLRNLKIEYFNQKELWLTENSPEYLEKFFREGSAATYIAIHFREDVPQFRAIAYGDSAFFCYRPSTNTLIGSNIINLSVYTQYPVLFDCVDPEIEEKKLFFEYIDYQKGDILLVASDAIAQYLLIEFMLQNEIYASELETYLNYPHALANYIYAIKEQRNINPISFTDLINQFFNFSSADFLAYFQTQQTAHTIAQDDYTLILLEL